MIATHYIREAVRIRNRFAQINSLLENYEKEIGKMRTELESLKETVSGIRVGMYGAVRDKQVHEAITQFERYEAKVKNKIKPLEDELHSLRKQSDALYDALTERYPQYTDEQLKDMLFQQII